MIRAGRRIECSGEKVGGLCTATACPLHDALDLVHQRRLNALGRLIQKQHLRPADKRPSDRELLLLAAREQARLPSRHLLEHGEQRKGLV
jgi:hypothetical protein